MRFCKCGSVLLVGENCKVCRPTPKKGTTECGYGYDHKKASERHRANYPLCERCLMLGGVVGSQASEDMHHVISIAESEANRMNPNNWLALCKPCHDVLEGDTFAGMEVRRWSDLHYVDVLNQGLS